MQDLIIHKTANTPAVVFSSTTGVLSIEGRSIPENPSSFYRPLSQWAQDYFHQPKETTQLLIKLEYINSGSSKSLLEFLRNIKEYNTFNKKIVIKWHFESDDEAVQELGEHFSNTLKMPFEFISY